MTTDISSELFILSGVEVKDPEAKRAFTVIGQWITNLEKKLDKYIENNKEYAKEKKKDRQFWINVGMVMVLILEPIIFIIFHI
ncbi:MAG: hypothetical protein M1498_04285 [Candidatus Thermoplasmatota archaeon]|nr:hypothetical protein [Candidatus Thermoplasmatota archaeon]MCL5889324.1 hypothetical protein [Candidatus Thermoplasmatota archaeon]